jgi:putative methanogenesis marker protein 12
MMFAGVDHGTTAIRFATSEGRCWELPRIEAGTHSQEKIIEQIKQNLGSDIKLIAMSYSMGDGLTEIVRLEDAPNRGLVQQDGAGLHIGGGTRVFDAIKGSGWPAILLPGIHRGSDIDPRLKVFSHGMSGEKVGLAYFVHKKEVPSFIVCDASSNTVTFGVVRGKIVGAIDAPIFAPGLTQGPLDVEAIRAVDSGKISANQGFSRGGILAKLGYSNLEECGTEMRAHALDSLALFAAMEIKAMEVLLKDLGEASPQLYLAGSPALEIESRVTDLLGREVRSLGRCAAAQGCAMIAEDVYNGVTNILGLKVNKRARSWTDSKPALR